MKELDIYFKIYLKGLVRYIHQNPEKAGICKTNNYKWSSFNDFLYNNILIDKKYVLNLFNNDINVFVNFNIEINNSCEDDIEYEFLENIDDDLAIELIKEQLKIDNLEEITKYNNIIRNQYLKQIKRIKWISKRQICRIIKIDRKTLDKI